MGNLLYKKHPPSLATTYADIENHALHQDEVLVGTPGEISKVIVNRLGIRVAAFATEDVDIARPARLALEQTPKGGLLQLLRESGINFVDATGLPYFRYLLAETQTGVALSSHGVAAVRVPIPERFALHKLIVAQLREGRPEKSRKDLKQAAVLIAALGELYPGAIEEAFSKTASSSRKHIRNSLLRIRDELEAHPQALEEAARAAKLT
jgi:hypothetical protein